jgi:ectoine hydroxylase-related dioxygenase (phytanoyl-CoA dioxygenase family)
VKQDFSAPIFLTAEHAPADHLRQFESSGFTVLQNLLDDLRVESLRRIWTNTAVELAGGLRICGNEVFYDELSLVLDLVASQKVLDLIECIVGPFVQLDSVALVGVGKESDSRLSWHRDPYGGLPRGTSFQRPLCVHLLVYLQDMNDISGPLRVLPSSHRRPTPLPERCRNLPLRNELLLRIKSGDGVLIHNNLLHSRTPNNSKSPRIHFSVIYNLSCMKSTIDYRHPNVVELKNNLVTLGDARLLRLLGDDKHAEQRYNSGFLRPDRESWNKWIQEELNS